MDFRKESDLIGELEVPAEAYYGVQTQRGINNYKITNHHTYDYPEFIKAFGYVKKAAAKANYELDNLDKNIYDAIVLACDEVIAGKHDKEFPTDMIQGGAGTTVNMNANEVIANIALEKMGFPKGDYQHCHPNDHVNRSQSTNDAYPTAIKLGLIFMNETLDKKLSKAVDAFREKGKEFRDIIKMGRTQLQDAVPMTLGQEFEAFAATLEAEKEAIARDVQVLKEINMGATAIGTELNTPIGYTKKVTKDLSEMTGLDLVSSKNLVAATPDTGSYVHYSGSLKRLALRLSKICNDLRLLASGPRAGLFEINLPAAAPGSSIMPGKVNPVIPEVVNQTCFRVIGNDLTVSFAAEAGQLQLNVMEPVLCFAIMESVQYLGNALDTLVDKCVSGITANSDSCTDKVKNSIGIVTALSPYIGYKPASKIAKEALKTGERVYDLVLKHELLPQEQLDTILDPKNMVRL